MDYDIQCDELTPEYIPTVQDLRDAMSLPGTKFTMTVETLIDKLNELPLDARVVLFIGEEMDCEIVDIGYFSTEKSGQKVAWMECQKIQEPTE